MEAEIQFNVLTRQSRHCRSWFCACCCLDARVGLSWGSGGLGQEVVAGERRLGQVLRSQIPALQLRELGSSSATPTWPLSTPPASWREGPSRTVDSPPGLEDRRGMPS